MKFGNRITGLASGLDVGQRQGKHQAYISISGLSNRGNSDAIC